VPEDPLAAPGDLEARLRHALGAPQGPARAGDPARTRADILARVRRRHRQRLQVAAGGLVAALGLGLTVPLAVEGGAPAQPTEKSASAGPEVPSRAAPVAQTSSATCRIGVGGPATPCGAVGTVAYGAANATPESTAASTGTAGRTAPVGGATRPIVLRVGERATVELPAASTHLPWQPLPADSGGAAGSHHVVAIQPTARRGLWRIVAQHGGSTVLRFTRSGCAGAGPCPDPTSIWSLYVEVTS
jgi:hypothetical protein